VIQHAIRRSDAAGGISISASHNEAEWNAIKFFGPLGTYLSTAEAGELLDIYHLRKFNYVDWEQIGSLREENNAIDPYLDALAGEFDIESIKRFRVVVDCCNGTSSLILRRLNARFGTEFILINERPNGVQFAHDPLISAQTIALQLAPLVCPLRADAGFQFDVDSDRVGIAAEDGTAVSEELILPLLADWILPQRNGKIIITNLSSTRLLEDVAARHGGNVVRVPVGRQATIDALASYPSEDLALAGEGTGAVMMPQFEFIYDGIASMLGILSLMAERRQSLSSLLNEYPRHYMLKGEVPLTSARVPQLLMNLQKRNSDGTVNVQDGLRVDWPDRWFHIRVSQTEPIIRVICEQRDTEPRALFEALMDAARTMA
jgi:phosphomannomutase